MYQITLFVVRRLLQETSRSQSLLGLIILLALVEEKTFLRIFHKQRCNRNGPNGDVSAAPRDLNTQHSLLGGGIKRYHGKGAGN